MRVRGWAGWGTQADWQDRPRGCGLGGLRGLWDRGGWGSSCGGLETWGVAHDGLWSRVLEGSSWRVLWGQGDLAQDRPVLGNGA